MTEGVELLSLGPVDDDSQGPIPIPEPGFPFGNSIQTEAYVRIKAYSQLVASFCIRILPRHVHPPLNQKF